MQKVKYKNSFLCLMNVSRVVGMTLNAFLIGMEGPFGGGMENMGRFGSGMNMGRINGKNGIFSCLFLVYLLIAEDVLSFNTVNLLCMMTHFCFST